MRSRLYRLVVIAAIGLSLMGCATTDLPPLFMPVGHWNLITWKTGQGEQECKRATNLSLTPQPLMAGADVVMLNPGDSLIVCPHVWDIQPTDKRLYEQRRVRL